MRAISISTRHLFRSSGKQAVIPIKTFGTDDKEDCSHYFLLQWSMRGGPLNCSKGKHEPPPWVAKYATDTMGKHCIMHEV